MSLVPTFRRTKTATLHQAAVRSDDYLLTHKTSFGKAGRHIGDKARKQNEVDTNMGSQSFRNTPPARVPSGPTCYYCKKKEHVMAECQALEKKNQRSPKPNLLIGPKNSSSGSKPLGQKVEDVSKSFAPFISQGFGHPAETPIKILRDAGATQTLILEGVLPFSNESFTGNSVLLQGIKWSYCQI